MPEWQTAAFVGSEAMHRSHFFPLQVMLLCRWNRLKGTERRKIIASRGDAERHDESHLARRILGFRLGGVNVSSTTPRS